METVWMESTTSSSGRSAVAAAMMASTSVLARTDRAELAGPVGQAQA